MQNTTFDLELKKLTNDGSFSGYASLFSMPDSHKDVVEPGAFQDTLNDPEKARKIKLLWQHRADEPIGRITRIEEDAQGLYVEGQLLLDVARGREAHSLLKSGAIRGLSIGYRVKEAEINHETGIRHLKKIDLFEISLVTFPANERAEVRLVKEKTGDRGQKTEKNQSSAFCLPSSVREFEHFLRDAGFSREQAKRIASEGFEAKQREAEAPKPEEWVALDRVFDKAFQALSAF